MGGDAAGRAALRILYVDTFTMAVGFYMLIPLLAFHFLDDVGLTIAVVAALTAVRTAAQNGTMPLAGWVADHIGFRNAILIGVLVRASGFALLGASDHVAMLTVASLLTGLGGALFHPASYSAYAALAPEGDRVRVYATREVISNVGFIAGPALGGVLAGVDFAIVSTGSAALFLVAFVVSFFGLPREARDPDRTPPRLRTAFLDMAFLRYCALVAGMGVMITQFYLVIPFRADQLLPGSIGVGVVYSGAAVVMVVTMLPLTAWTNRTFTRPVILAGAAVLLGGGIAVIGAAPTTPVMLLGVAVFVVGQMLAQPVMNAVVSGFAPDGSVASYFGVQGLATAIGAITGSAIGGVVYSVAGSDPRTWAWLFFPVWGAVVASAFAVARPGSAPR
ncbi:MFS transporter [Microbacterium aquimaris]|uniref:MFS transporter n=1 Tax=Microbacterium aquimaris TaxID=459816 RepID=A0ABU5N2U9_9MICO|nr:MFS transporter [Microbacterium aquimaris]MDZ8160387.1 MFS transporter [Microbacterium aquimaris]